MHLMKDLAITFYRSTAREVIERDGSVSGHRELWAKP
jgi:hypothetical protein